MGKMDDLRGQLKEKMSAGNVSQVSVARATGIDQGVLSHFLNEPEYGLGGKNALRITEWIKGQEGNLVAVDNREESLSPRIRDLEARIAEQDARLADKDKIIELLEKHIAMLEGSEGNALKIEIFQYINMLAERAGREGRTLADIVAFHWSDLPRLGPDERDILWQLTRSILSRHPEFSRPRSYDKTEQTALPCAPENKKEIMVASLLNVAQKVIYDLRDALDDGGQTA